MSDASALISPQEAFERYKNKVYGLALSIVHNPSDAEDITQNAFVKIIKNLSRFRGSSRLSTWIYRVAYNEALMFLRKIRGQNRLDGYLRRSAKKFSSGLFVNWSKLPDQNLLDKELKERIDSAIRHMPIVYRMPLVLSSAQGLPLKDAAKILGLKLASLKTRLYRARLGIRQELSAYFKDRMVPEQERVRGCSALINFIYDYARAKQDNKRRLRFGRHIQDCPSCRVFMDRYLEAIRITKALECQDLPPDLQKKIETFLLAGHLNNGKRGR